MLPVGTLISRYRIVSLIGSGGMGEVYRAHDPRLGRNVAIKVIKSHLALDSDRVRRFEQEARAAGALSHPNVCTIHDVGTHDGSPFVVMELLEGESLRSLLGSGALPPRKAIDYAAQAAHGLAAAHEKGIVHRDLKPENLFVTKDGRVKVLDFGLAKLTRPEEQALQESEADSVAATETGMILGTTGYMAPEQVRGQAADARSDLFALGAILYEMLSGRRAFQGASTVEILNAILHEEPASLDASARGLPPGLEDIVRHCLEKKPEERFQSARDLAFQLQSLTVGATATPARRRERSGAGRWVAFAAAGAAVAAAVAVFLGHGGIRAAPGLVPRRVAVAVFENQTGDPGLGTLGRMASDWITQGLSCVQGLEVVPSGSILYIQPAGKGNRSGRDPIQQLARQTGAGTIVSGAYYLEADSLRFQARIDDVAHGRLLMALAPATCARGAPLQAIDALRQRVMGAVAARLESVHEMGTQQQPPRYDAYCEFIAGFEIFETDEREGLKHFQRASALDRDFLPPLFYEAYLLDRLGDHARVGEILRTLSEQREDLLPFGRQWLDVMLAYASHRYPEALQHARLALRKAPGDPMTTLWVGFMAAVSNRPREVIETFRRFGPRPYPDQQLGANWMVHLCGALHRLGEHRRELDEAHRARVQYPAQADLWEIEADALAALGRVRELNRLVDERLLATPAGGAPEDMMLEAADELRAHGRREASIGLANRVLSRFRSRPPAGGEEDSLAGLVQALRRAERWSEAAAICRALAARLPQNPDYLGMLGALEARLGRRDEAARIDEELRALKDPYLFGAHTFRRACIAALLGDRMRAVDLLRTSLAEGKPFGVAIHREMDLETLWDYGPYQALMRPQG